jgi:hypothetical protein
MGEGFQIFVLMEWNDFMNISSDGIADLHEKKSGIVAY